MRIDKDNTFLFQKGNKNDLISNPPDDGFLDDFTLLAEFTVDYKNLIEETSKAPYYSQTIIAKNGKHMGLFLTVNETQDDVLLVKLNFEWWETTDTPDIDSVKSVDLYLKEEALQKPIQVAITRKGNQVTINAMNQKETAEIGNLIDYSNSYMWVGTSNMLWEGFNHILTGDISKLHFQKEVLTEDEIDAFWVSYDIFVKIISQNSTRTIFFTSNFENYTPYKVRDDSYNFNHLIKFSKEWMN